MRRLIAASVVSLVALAGLRDASAQAWVEEKGVLGFGGTYQFDSSNTIVEGDGEIEFGEHDTTAQTLHLSASYTPIEKLGLNIGIPLLLTRYTGEGQLFPPHGEFDDGDSHLTLQDLRVGARYQLLDSPLALTPNIGFTLPMTDYPIQGFAAPGRHVKKLHLGLAVGRTLEPFLPNLYFAASYEFSLAEAVDDQPELEDFGQSHSQFGIQVGYFIGSKLSAGVSFDGFIHHDGMELIDYFDFAPAARDYHDAILKEEVFLLGLSAGYSITDQLSATVFGRIFLFGDNTRIARQFGFNLSFDLPVATESAPSEEEDDSDDEVADER